MPNTHMHAKHSGSTDMETINKNLWPAFQWSRKKQFLDKIDKPILSYSILYERQSLLLIAREIYNI